MSGRSFDEIDHDAWLIEQADKNCPDCGDDRYEAVKNWLGYSDEEMEGVDLDSQYDAYLDWEEGCREEAEAEARAEAMIARWESYADNW